MRAQHSCLCVCLLSRCRGGTCASRLAARRARRGRDSDGPAPPGQLTGAAAVERGTSDRAADAFLVRFLHLGSTATGTGGPRIALHDMVNGGLPRDAATDGKPDRVYTACILTPNALNGKRARHLTPKCEIRVKLELILRKHGGTTGGRRRAAGRRGPRRTADRVTVHFESGMRPGSNR